jgi:predicted PurR-regulated permease PerM
MLETSSDLLNIVIAFCVLWLTVFICWFLYYIVTTIKRVSETADQLAKMAGNVNDFFQEAKTRLHSATSYLPLIVEGVKHATEYFRDKQSSKTKTKPKSTKKS